MKEKLLKKWDRLKAIVAYKLIRRGVRVHPEMFERMAVVYLAHKAMRQGSMQVSMDCDCDLCTAQAEEQEAPIPSNQPTYH